MRSRKELEIHSLEEAKQYIIGVPRDDNQHQFLKKKGFDNLYITKSFDSALKMLYANRLDLVMGTEISIVYRLKKLNLDYSELKKRYDVGQQWGDLSIAFSMNTPDELVHIFQKALDKIKKDGTYENIMRKWIPNHF